MDVDRNFQKLMHKQEGGNACLSLTLDGAGGHLVYIWARGAGDWAKQVMVQGAGPRRRTWGQAGRWCKQKKGFWIQGQN
jgi:hypothetical protein